VADDKLTLGRVWKQLCMIRFAKYIVKTALAPDLHCCADSLATSCWQSVPHSAQMCGRRRTSGR
jgi:hypothetical protein